LSLITTRKMDFSISRKIGIKWTLKAFSIRIASTNVTTVKALKLNTSILLTLK
jgi:hypothetical protein